MKFRVGRFTCEVLLGEDGKMRVKWLPGPPKYFNKAERDQYQAGLAKFMEELERKLGIGQNSLSVRERSPCGLCFHHGGACCAKPRCFHARKPFHKYFKTSLTPILD